MTDRSTEELDRLGSWLRTEAAERSIEDIFQLVRTEMDAMYSAITAVPVENLDQVPPGEEWSPLATLQHAVQANVQIAEDVLNVCLTGVRPGNPEPQLPLDRDVLIQAQREMNDSLWEHVSFADPGAFLDATWPHMFFGELNWREWLFFLHMHAWDHRHQIEALGELLRA